MQDDLAMLITSRICHDLAGPVGTIKNEVDLMIEIAGGRVSEEVALMGRSANWASDRLQFFRIAFGAVVSDAAPLSRSQLANLMGAYLSGVQAELDWPDPGGPELARRDARLLSVMALCAKATVGMRGRLAVTLDPGKSFPAEVAAIGRRAVINDGQRAALETGQTEDAKIVEFAVLNALAIDAGRTVTLDTGEGRVSLSAT